MGFRGHFHKSHVELNAYKCLSYYQSLPSAVTSSDMRKRNNASLTTNAKQLPNSTKSGRTFNTYVIYFPCRKVKL
jgi:hypothetical protein